MGSILSYPADNTHSQSYRLSNSAQTYGILLSKFHGKAATLSRKLANLSIPRDQ